MAVVIPLGNFPAGYDCVGSAYAAHTDCIVSSIWLVPGGGPVYCHTALTSPDEVHDEALWRRTVERVQHHVQGRMLGLQSVANGVSTYRGMALSNNPPNAGDLYVNVPTPPSLNGTRNAAGDFDLAPAGTGQEQPAAE